MIPDWIAELIEIRANLLMIDHYHDKTEITRIITSIAIYSFLEGKLEGIREERATRR